jgi:hypothetical protein
MDALPPELLRACLTELSSASDLLRAARVSHGFFREATCDELWSALYHRRWPTWTLLVPDLLITPPWREVYRRRHLGCLRLKLTSSLVHALHGTTTDNYDSNKTPVEAVLCMAPHSRVNDALELSGKLVAQVHFGNGSLHNSSTVKCWYGKAVVGDAAAAAAAASHEAPAGPSVSTSDGPQDREEDDAAAPVRAVRVEWREHSSSFGHWVYEGWVSFDGRMIMGTFHLSVLKRKRGMFELYACDPATHVGDALGGLPTAHQLAKRVAVKWCSAALARAAAREGPAP